MTAERPRAAFSAHSAARDAEHGGADGARARDKPSGPGRAGPGRAKPKLEESPVPHNQHKHTGACGRVLRSRRRRRRGRRVHDLSHVLSCKRNRSTMLWHKTTMGPLPGVLHFTPG
ncbi:hypothetical protein SRHO_G00035290 [Serrasalmus rhombeus]